MSDTLVAPFGAAMAPVSLSANALAASFHEASRKSALTAFQSGPSDVFEQAELETRLWDLVARLTSVLPSTYSEHQSEVVKWLQSNLPEVLMPSDLQSIKWMYTKHRATKGGPNAVVSELDLDAPLRQALPIAEEDAKTDETLYQYVFELLLIGDYEQAQTVCAETNNWQLKAALSIVDPLPPLCLQAFHQLSTEPRLNQWESAIYGLLSRNLLLVKPLCDSWEKLLLVHLLCNASLADFERAVAENPVISAQHAHWCRRIVLTVIEQTSAQLVRDLVQETVGQPASSALVSHPYLIRILLHLQLVLNLAANCEPLVDHQLARVYIEYLCDSVEDLGERLALVPEYVRLLPSDRQFEVYGFVLAQITNISTQNNQLELANRYGISLPPVLEHAVALNFELASTVFVESELAASSGSSTLEAVSASNHRLVGVLRWLIAAELWPTAASALLRAYLLFFTQNRRSGAVLLAQQISTATLVAHARQCGQQLVSSPDLVGELHQLQQCTQLAEALAALDALPAADRCDTTARRLAAPAIRHATDAVSAALCFGTRILAPENSATADEIALVRQRFVPLIVYELLNALTSPRAAKCDAQTALQFAVKIADEDTKLYELFDASLLSVLAKPALML